VGGGGRWGSGEVGRGGLRVGCADAAEWSWEGRTKASGAGWELDRIGLGTRVTERMGSSWGI
jgi:hypothetical protein